jgi:hypothetical protein
VVPATLEAKAEGVQGQLRLNSETIITKTKTKIPQRVLSEVKSLQTEKHEHVGVMTKGEGQ